MTSVAVLSAMFREKKLVIIRIKAMDYFHNIFRSRLSDPISLFTHLEIHLKHTRELAWVPEGSLQTKASKSGKYSEA